MQRAAVAPDIETTPYLLAGRTTGAAAPWVTAASAGTNRMSGFALIGGEREQPPWRTPPPRVGEVGAQAPGKGVAAQKSWLTRFHPRRPALRPLRRNGRSVPCSRPRRRFHIDWT